MALLLRLARQRTLCAALSQPARVGPYVKFSTEGVVSTDGQESSAEANKKVGGFAKAYQKHSDSLNPEQPNEPPKTFASLLRNSKLVDVSKGFGFSTSACKTFTQHSSSRSSWAIRRERL